MGAIRHSAHVIMDKLPEQASVTCASPASCNSTLASHLKRNSRFANILKDYHKIQFSPQSGTP